MANNVFTDPDHIRQFSTDLSSFRENVANLTAQIQAQLGSLGDTWRDEAYQQFCEVFGRARHRIDVFSGQVEQTLPKLARDAENAEAYQREQMPTD